MTYFNDIKRGIRTTVKGLSLTLRHLRNATKRRTPVGIADANYFELQTGLVTLQYPYEQLPIPDNGRYRLRNEIDDCIVCDKCAKICPVDCITIDAIKATEEVGRASDGSPIRLYAATFDIDMAKCCYCGLCTVVCPTECLTMDKKFDYSEFDLGKLTYEFANLTPQEADEKRALYEQFVLEKEAAKTAQATAKPVPASTPEGTSSPTTAPKRPVFRPTAKPTAPTSPPAESANTESSASEHPLTDATPTEMEQIAQGGLETVKHPVFRPTQKLAPKPTDVPADDKPAELNAPTEKPPSAKPSFRPTMKPPKAADPVPEPDEHMVVPNPKPAGFRPTMKPASEPETSAPTLEPTVTENTPEKVDTPISETPKPKPTFRPTMKPKSNPDD